MAALRLGARRQPRGPNSRRSGFTWPPGNGPRPPRPSVQGNGRLAYLPRLRRDPHLSLFASSYSGPPSRSLSKSATLELQSSRLDARSIHLVPEPRASVTDYRTASPTHPAVLPEPGSSVPEFPLARVICQRVTASRDAPLWPPTCPLLHHTGLSAVYEAAAARYFALGKPQFPRRLSLFSETRRIDSGASQPDVDLASVGRLPQRPIAGAFQPSRTDAGPAMKSA